MSTTDGANGAAAAGWAWRAEVRPRGRVERTKGYSRGLDGVLDGPSRTGYSESRGRQGYSRALQGVLDAGADHSNQKTSRMRRGTTDGWYTSRYLQARVPARCGWLRRYL